MDRQTARRSRRLVTAKPTAVQRTRSTIARVVGVVLLIVVIYATVAIATGKA